MGGGTTMLPDDLPEDMPSFLARFGTDEQCREYLFKARWPEGFRCAACGHDDAYTLRTKIVYECVARQHDGRAHSRSAREATMARSRARIGPNPPTCGLPFGLECSLLQEKFTVILEFGSSPEKEHEPWMPPRLQPR